MARIRIFGRGKPTDVQPVISYLEDSEINTRIDTKIAEHLEAAPHEEAVAATTSTTTVATSTPVTSLNESALERAILLMGA